MRTLLVALSLLLFSMPAVAGRQAHRDRAAGTPDFLSLEELTEGRLTGGRQANLPRSAAGYYEVGGEMAVGSGKTCILDGAVFLRLE
jgi:hypothetical protein